MPPKKDQFPRLKRSEIIAEHLRDRITRGDLAPHDRLPTLSDLESHYGVSRVTVQRAFDRLRQEGFIEGKGRQGTFVVECPPNIARYGCVMMNPPDTSGVSQFNTFITKAMNRVATQQNARAAFYYFRTPDSAGYDRFCQDLANGRLAGAIFMQEPSLFIGPIKQIAPQLPTTSFLLVKTDTEFDSPALAVNTNAFFKAALSHMACDSIRTCACLLPMSPIWSPISFERQFTKTATPLGVSTRMEWLHAHDLSNYDWLLPWLHTLAHSAPTPEALLIWDDHMVAPCTRLLKKHFSELANKLHICAHANFPDISKSHLPAFRYGINWDDAMAKAFQLMNQQRQGIACKAKQYLPVTTNQSE